MVGKEGNLSINFEILAAAPSGPGRAHAARSRRKVLHPAQRVVVRALGRAGGVSGEARRREGRVWSPPVVQCAGTLTKCSPNGSSWCTSRYTRPCCTPNCSPSHSHMHTSSVAVDTYSSSHACPIDGSSVAYVAFEIPPPRALRGRERCERREAHEVRLNPRKKGKMSNDGRPTSSNCFWKLGPDDPSTKKPVCITAASRMVANFKDGACADDGSSALVRRLVVFSLAG